MPDFLSIYITFLVFVIGIVIGSFLNVVILRRLADESIVNPPSKCPKCNHPLKWWHNIPLLSFMLLRGKCYFCHEKISIQYFLVELTTGLLFVGSFLKFEYSIETLLVWVILSLFVVMSVTDIKEKVIFDRHSISLAITGLIFSAIHTSIIEGLLGLVIGIVIMELAAAIGYMFVKSRAFGVGDTFILAGLGAILGWKGVITVLILAMILFAIAILPMFLKNLYSQKDFKTFWACIIFILILITDRIYMSFKSANVYMLQAITLLLICSSIFTILNILKGLRNKNTKGLMLPFGPALFVAGTILLFIL